MVILPLLFASLFSLGMPKETKNAKSDYKDMLVTVANERGNYTLMGISPSFSGDEFRIYHYDDLIIDEIDDSAFSGVTFTSLMLTNDVDYINDAAFDTGSSIKRLYFTGSEDEFAELHLNHSFDYVSYYSKDEGFINFWNEKIRKTEDVNICDISKDTFNRLYALYKNLSAEDLVTVDNYKDIAGAKISDSMKELIRVFAGTQPSQKKDEWNQTGAITLIIVVAVLGMTSITIFFLLKTRHIID